MSVTARLILAALLVLASLSTAVAVEPRTLSGVLYGGYLLVLREGGEITAWNQSTLSLAREKSVPVSDTRLERIAVTGTTLWGASSAAVFQWSPKKREWKQTGKLANGAEKLDALAAVGTKRFAVFASKVIDAASSRAYPIPKLPGYHSGLGPPFKILAAYGTDSRLWIGTGKGEWGGALLGLDPASGKWSNYTDGEASSITEEPDGEVTVNWSNWHLVPHAKIRVHEADASVKWNYSEVSDTGYRTIAFNPFDGVLYGIDESNLVSIVGGAPTRIAPLASPAKVLSLLPTAAGEMIIVPVDGEPYKLAGGTHTRFEQSVDSGELICDYRVGIKGPPPVCKRRKAGAVRSDH